MAVSALAIPVPDSTVAPGATPSSVPTDLAVYVSSALFG